MKFAEIQDAIYNWFVSTTEVKAVWAEQEGPRLERPYAMLKLITGPVKTNGMDQLSYLSGDKFELRGDRTVTCSINVMGSGAHDIAALARDSLDDPTIVDQLSEKGLAVWDEGDVRDLTQKLETHWETRAQLDVVFAFASSYETNTGWIEKVELEGDYGDVETNTVVNQ
jgi:hypothetical protein